MSYPTRPVPSAPMKNRHDADVDFSLHFADALTEDIFVSVPLGALHDRLRATYRAGWDACRAQMIQAAMDAQD